jgi:signal transduction histidine kinase
MNVVILVVGLFLSSLVSVSIIFDYMDKLFDRKYVNKWLYVCVKLGFIICLAGINSLKNEWMNLITVILLAEIICLKIYIGNKKNQFLYLIIIVICMGACESIGITLLHIIYKMADVSIASDKMNSLFDITITQVVVIFINHAILLQIMKKKNINDLSNQQYIFSFIYSIFSIINIYILSRLLIDTSSESEIIIVLINIVGIIVINTHFLKILEYASENNRLQYENNLFVQQSNMQYLYYDKLEQQYLDSLSILHDVKKHIRTIEELYRHNEEATALEYSKDITNILDSFRLNEFTDHRVLNIILNDKIRIAEQNNIKFICRIDHVDLSFIDNIDLTTIFANLLENAIEACMNIKGDKTIMVQVGSFNNLIVINIKNTIRQCNKEISVNMKSSKKNHEGIGIPNVQKVVSKYNGDFNIQKEEDMFVCSIVISKQGRITY